MTKIPPKLIRIKDKIELYRLKDGARVPKPENMVPDIGKPFWVYSPYGKTHYSSEVREFTSWVELDKYIKQGNVYKIDE